MGINDLFYNDRATIMIAMPTKPNEWGIIENTYEILAEDIPASITPISTQRSQQAYGIESNVRFEVSMDYVDNCELATKVVVDDVAYEVVTFVVYPAFMCLPKSITYGVKR